jgi:hypothetical protein
MASLFDSPTTILKRLKWPTFAGIKGFEAVYLWILIVRQSFIFICPRLLDYVTVRSVHWFHSHGGTPRHRLGAPVML